MIDLEINLFSQAIGWLTGQLAYPVMEWEWSWKVRNLSLCSKLFEQ